MRDRCFGLTSGSQLFWQSGCEIGGTLASCGSHRSLDLHQRTGIVGPQQFDAIAACTLGYIESGIGPAEQRIEIAGDTDIRRGADADRGADRQAVDKRGGIGEGMAYGFAGACRIQRIGARQDGYKFLAAEASDDAPPVEMRRRRRSPGISVKLEGMALGSGHGVQNGSLRTILSDGA